MQIGDSQTVSRRTVLVGGLAAAGLLGAVALIPAGNPPVVAISDSLPNSTYEQKANRAVLEAFTQFAMTIIGEDEFPRDSILYVGYPIGEKQTYSLDPKYEAMAGNPKTPRLLVEIPKEDLESFSSSPSHKTHAICVIALINSLANHKLAEGKTTEQALSYGRKLFLKVLNSSPAKRSSCFR